MEEKEMKKKDVAADFFGSVQLIKAEGGFKAHPEKIFTSLEGTGTIINLFCSGCGHYSEITRETAEEYIKTKLPEFIEDGLFIETSGCEICDGEKKYSLQKMNSL